MGREALGVCFLCLCNLGVSTWITLGTVVLVLQTYVVLSRRACVTEGYTHYGIIGRITFIVVMDSVLKCISIFIFSFINSKR